MTDQLANFDSPQTDFRLSEQQATIDMTKLDTLDRALDAWIEELERARWDNRAGGFRAIRSHIAEHRARMERVLARHAT